MVSMVSDCKTFQEKKDHLLMSSATVTATAGGSLSVHMEVPRWAPREGVAGGRVSLGGSGE